MAMLLKIGNSQGIRTSKSIKNMPPQVVRTTFSEFLFFLTYYFMPHFDLLTRVFLCLPASYHNTHP